MTDSNIVPLDGSILGDLNPTGRPPGTHDTRTVYPSADALGFGKVVNTMQNHGGYAGNYY